MNKDGKRSLVHRESARQLLGKVKRRLRAESAQLPDLFYVDEPNGTPVRSLLVISGWYLPAEPNTIVGLRALMNNRVIPLEFNTDRPDVAADHPDRPDALKSGFYERVPYEENGTFILEIDKGDGYKPFFSIEVEQDLELLADMAYNPALATRYAEHMNLLDSRKQYFYENDSERSFKLGKDDPRLVALYLPQFHPIPENDKAWGKGFTEWRNVASAVPRFIGHQQPFLPQDLGFYDLRLDTVISDQIALAKKYGIYGFCFYYYWFSGKQLLEKPLQSFLKHKEWDFNFMICWANENWTKRWDGKDDDVIVAQKYKKEDPLDFIKDVEHILTDPRYIREDGKPVLMVYRPKHLKDPARYVSVWREYMRKTHNLELHIVSVLSFDFEDPRPSGFDMAMDFVPTSLDIKKSVLGSDGLYMDVSDSLLDINFNGIVGDYRNVALSNELYPYFEFPTYKCVMPSWDNDARKKGGGHVQNHTSPDLYARWLDYTLEFETKDRKDPIIFLNAWNEWAEGTVLEPTLHLGHATLTRTAEVLANYSNNKQNKANWPKYRLQDRSKNTKIAVVVHVFYEEEWRAIAKKLKLFGKNKFDLFVTLPLKKQHLKTNIHEQYPSAQIIVVPNRGRDVLPFVMTARRLDDVGYQQILKLHTKRSPHLGNGADWFTLLLDCLLPSEQGISDIIQALADSPGMVGARGHYLSLSEHIGNNREEIYRLINKMYGKEQAENILGNTDDLGFMASTMFWTSSEVIKPLLDMYLLPDDFQAEKGQVDGTTAHAIERLITVVAKQEGGVLQEVDKKGRLYRLGKPLRKFPYLPKSKEV